MYIFPSKAEVTQISLTGARLIVILGALMVAPRDLDDLNKLVSDCGLVDKNYSSDTIRLALSTLKALGCEISRPCKLTDSKYVLLSHPFMLDFSPEEINSLRTVYSNLTKQDGYKTAVTFHKLILKLNERIYNQDTVNRLLGITGFANIEQSLFDKILDQIDAHNTIAISYKSPKGKITNHNIVFDKLYFRNNKLYMTGLDIDIDKHITLLVNRIASLDVVKVSDENIKSEAYEIIYELKNADKFKLPSGHKVVKIGKNGVAIVKGVCANDFFAMQHILSLGASATLLEPSDLREKIVNKLKEMRNIYA